MKKLTTIDFVNRAILKHQNKYNYDKVDYKNSIKKVIITCKKHGDFLQIPSNHLFGHGCIECSGKTQKNTQRFIEESNKMHNHNYNYDKVVYINSHSKVIITCKKHGDFVQYAYSHLYGIGCMECGGKTKKNTQKFIEEANKIHNHNFNYDKVVYKNKSEKIIITCKKHGDFEQIPNDHLRGRGCNECGGTNKSTNLKFIEEANKTHNQNYKYDKVIYVNMKTKVIIVCKKHGVFEQSPCDHLNGCGCPKCKSSKGEKLIYELLQKLNVKFEVQYKFSDCINKRKLPFDFAVFINDKIKLIEFHGEQHYKFNSFFHSRTNHEECLIRDKIKLDYAKENKIDLLIIPYNEKHNIEPLLIGFFLT